MGRISRAEGGMCSAVGSTCALSGESRCETPISNRTEPVNADGRMMRVRKGPFMKQSVLSSTM